MRAVKYEHHHGSTKIGFRGSDLMPSVSGEARVESKRGTMEIKAEFSGLEGPTTFGNEYLTYVMWAISPEGRAKNLGEVLVGDNHRSELNVTTDLQAFALIVTAEPYFAVTRPSDAAVAENEVLPGTAGTVEAVDAKFELIGRGGYIPSGFHFDPVLVNAELPLEFYEARNAMRIAQSAGAEEFASSSFGNAANQMQQADGLATMRHVDKKALIAESREVVQTAEDSREIAVKRIDEDRLNAERNTAATEVADANAKSTEDAQARSEAEAATARAERQRARADRAAVAAQVKQQAAEAESDRNRADAANANQAAADANQSATDAQQSEETQWRNRIVIAPTPPMPIKLPRMPINPPRMRSRAKETQRRNRIAAKPPRRIRMRNCSKWSAIAKNCAPGCCNNSTRFLPHARHGAWSRGEHGGCAVRLRQSTLRPAAREKLAKISGIVLAYPDLRLAIEGNTDSVGGDAMNQKLSEQRADAVRDYLAQQNVPMGSMTSQGFGRRSR